MISPKHILLEFKQKQFAQDSYTYRLANKFSRLDLAAILGISDKTVVSFERDMRPKVDVFFNMCRIMGKEVNDYFKPVDLNN